MADPSLRITTAGAAALADDDNVVGVNGPVTFTAIELGDGQGPGGAADDGRAALRSRRERLPVTGRASSASGTVAVQVTANAALAYDVTECGVMAQVGTGQEFLAAYWSDAGEVWFSRVANDPHLIGVLLRVGAPAADLAVTISPRVAFGTVDTFLELSDTPATYANAAGFFPRVKADGTGLELLDLEGTAPAGYRTIGELASKLRDIEEGRTAVGKRRMTIATLEADQDLAAGGSTTVLSGSMDMPVTGWLHAFGHVRWLPGAGSARIFLRTRVDGGAWSDARLRTPDPTGGPGVFFGAEDLDSGLLFPLAAGSIDWQFRVTNNHNSAITLQATDADNPFTTRSESVWIALQLLLPA